MLRSRSLAIVALLLSSLGCDSGRGDGPAKGWSQAGSLGQPRAFFSTTVLQSGTVLVAGGQPNYMPDWATAAADLFVPAARRWFAARPLGTSRNGPCAALLPSGKVLVAGGGNPSATSLDTAELYDPATDTFTPTSEPMGQARVGSTCTLLGTGKVLVAGGLDAAGTASVAEAELYDPATDTFAPTGALATARYWHTDTLLNSGKVLVVGGCVGALPCTAATGSAELYDPATGEWTGAGALAYPVMAHTATRLLSGQVLIASGCPSYDGVGGCRSDGVHERRASLYDPAVGAAGAWSLTGELATGRASHVALLLGGGDVLAVGGGYWSGTGTSTERYHPATGTWAGGPGTLLDHGAGAGAARLQDGTWLIVGGVVPSDAYLGASERFVE